jgi:hypothetical protein
MLTTLLAGCPEAAQPSADMQQRHQQEQVSQQSNAVAGFPAIENFGPKKTLKIVLELADKMSPTYSYVKDANGPFRKICDSMGYPIPYATQYTNPMKPAEKGTEGITTIPQADPTGLFSPAAADATWVLCLDPVTHQLAPFYEEEKVTTTPFPLKGAL